jgi:hypothetical protein
MSDKNEPKKKKSHYPPLPCGCDASTASNREAGSYSVKLDDNRRVCVVHGKIYMLKWVECKTVPIDT